jgi:Ca2+-binding RTX toxin-like protein
MRKALLVIPAVLAATLTPSISNAEVHKCHGQVATIVGTPGDDVIYGTSAVFVIAGLGGNDTIYGRGGGGTLNREAVLCGHGGSDTIYSDCGYDCYTTTFGGRGADRIESGETDMSLIDGGPGDDILVGQGDDDWPDRVSYASAPGPITANLESGVVTGYGTDTVTGFTDFVASDHGDTILGAGGSVDLYGGAGDDVMRAGLRAGKGNALFGDEGDDRLYGTGGSDPFFPGLGDDYIDGGLGRDSVTFEFGPIWASLSDGRAEGEGSDTLIGVESLGGSPYDDTLVGDAGRNELGGGPGGDRLYGRRGPDYLWEWDGDDGDELYGNRGNDSLFSWHPGGYGDGSVDKDLLSGGNHEDECHFRGNLDILTGCESRVRHPLR